jgi:[protein-PII] uridylyltransferase
MRRYYWAAKAVTQLSQILLLNIEERLNPASQGAMVRINDRFFDKAGLIEVASDDLYPRPAGHPGNLSDLRDLSRPADLSARTLRALYRRAA